MSKETPNAEKVYISETAAANVDNKMVLEIDENVMETPLVEVDPLSSDNELSINDSAQLFEIDLVKVEDDHSTDEMQHIDDDEGAPGELTIDLFEENTKESL